MPLGGCDRGLLACSAVVRPSPDVVSCWPQEKVNRACFIGGHPLALVHPDSLTLLTSCPPGKRLDAEALRAGFRACLVDESTPLVMTKPHYGN